MLRKPGARLAILRFLTNGFATPMALSLRTYRTG